MLAGSALIRHNESIPGCGEEADVIFFVLPCDMIPRFQGDVAATAVCMLTAFSNKTVHRLFISIYALISLQQSGYQSRKASINTQK